jgi:hypothetical protein
LHPLGTTVTDQLGRKYRYSKAGAAIALGDCLIWSAAIFTVIPVAAADQSIVGCWPNENPPSGTARTAVSNAEFFFALIAGDALVKAAATVVAGAPAISIATAGTVDDTAATAANALASAVTGPFFLTTTTSGFARVMFNG